MSRAGLLWSILAVYAPLSLLTIGGGQGILSEVHRQAVEQQGWISEDSFVTLFGLSRMAPGPGSLLLVLIGFDAAGLPGALVAAVAIFLPSSLLVYGLARLWARHRGAAWTGAVERGLAPVAAGLMLSAALTLLQASRGGPLAWGVAAASTAVLYTTRASPFLLLGAGALVFLLLR